MTDTPSGRLVKRGDHRQLTPGEEEIAKDMKKNGETERYIDKTKDIPKGGGSSDPEAGGAADSGEGSPADSGGGVTEIGIGGMPEAAPCAFAGGNVFFGGGRGMEAEEMF